MYFVDTKKYFSKLKLPCYIAKIHSEVCNSDPEHNFFFFRFIKVNGHFATDFQCLRCRKNRFMTFESRFSSHSARFSVARMLFHFRGSLVWFNPVKKPRINKIFDNSSN